LRQFSATLLGLFGLAIIGLLTWLVVAGTRHPTADKSIGIALLSVVGAPIALNLFGAGYRRFQGPNSTQLRTEAEASRRAAGALEDAESAEEIKAELEAYVELRTWRLEIERKRRELADSADALVTALQELNADEKRLGLEMTRLSATTAETLDALLEPKPIFSIPDYVFFTNPLRLPGAIMGWATARLIERIAQSLIAYLQGRRMRRLREVSPEALSDPGSKGGPA
jgi:hypothetical protein